LRDVPLTEGLGQRRLSTEGAERPGRNGGTGGDGRHWCDGGTVETLCIWLFAQLGPSVALKAPGWRTSQATSDCAAKDNSHMPLPNLAARRPTVGRTTKRGAFGHIRQHRGPKRGFNQRRSSVWNGRDWATAPAQPHGQDGCCYWKPDEPLLCPGANLAVSATRGLTFDVRGGPLAGRPLDGGVRRRPSCLG
jgi:hypothetical protein